ncbi:OLC1v1019619C1 [Oldenlandia corymbosa var. corymbosa]|uniref:OLC1v1019619C1 n=1 Tax=Oldenlandia corymbosa var. corymbosa TaxID=529605 RepID=A0AAV1EEC8_OLDCO|nr:OLC1v1019619C1 [Oldenlandia corymbosa var. corymbosa]
MGSLSDLPEETVHHILSYLKFTPKQAIRLSILSKQLLSAFHTSPSLDFDLRRFPGDRQFSVEQHLYVLLTLERYKQQNIGLEKLKLQSEDFILLPRSFFQVTTLEELSLKGCKLMELERFATIKWPNLKRLSLVEISLSTTTFGCIVKGCPVIETLEIKDCGYTGQLNIKLTNFHRLREIDISLLYKQTVEVDEAPNLESVACKFHHSEDTAASKRLNFHKSAYQNVRSLFLDHRSGDSFSMDYWTRKFPRLEELSLEGFSKLTTIDIASPTLKRIHLVNIFNLEEAYFDLACIAVFDYRHDVYRKSVTIPKVSFNGVSGKWISHIKLGRLQHIEGLLHLNNFLTAIKGSEISITVELSNKVDADHYVAHSCPEVEEFCIMQREFSYISPHCAILRGIFGICHPRTISYQFYSEYDEFSKPFYDMLISKSYDYDADTSFFLLPKLWKLTEIEIFESRSIDRHGTHCSRRGRGLKICQPFPKFWKFRRELKAYLKESKKSMAEITISFNLEWMEKSSAVICKPKEHRDWAKKEKFHYLARSFS